MVRVLVVALVADVIAGVVDESRIGDFYTAIRRYWPELPDGAGWKLVDTESL